MAREKTIEKTIKAFVTKGMMVDPGALTRETILVNDLNADSMDIVNVVTAIEAKYKISFSYESKVQYERYTIQFLMDAVVNALHEKKQPLSRRKASCIKSIWKTGT